MKFKFVLIITCEIFILYLDENLDRFDGRVMLEMLRGKRLVFVGDSLNRNMWESLVCALRESLVDKSRVLEVSGRRKFRTRGFFSFLFKVCILMYLYNFSHIFLLPIFVTYLFTKKNNFFESMEWEMSICC